MAATSDACFSAGAVAVQGPAGAGHAARLSDTFLAWLTVERALIGGLILLAAATRLWALGQLPLQSTEAATALGSWDLAHGQGGSLSAGPLLVYGNALLFFAFGATDAAPRLLPAMGGIALVVLPFLLRRELGRGAVIAAAVVILVSPSLAYFSRLTDSAMLVAASALASAIFLSKLAVAPRRGWRYAAAIALGALALAGRDLYIVVLVLAVAALARGRAQIAPGASLRPVVLIALAVAALGASGLLTNPHGLQEGLIDPFGQWLRVSPAMPRALLPAAVLVVYEPLLLVFGVVGAIIGLRRGDSWARFLVWWAAAGLLAASLSGERSASGLVVALVPLALLAGCGIARAMEGLASGVSKLELASYLVVTVAMLSLFWITSQFFTMPGSIAPATVLLGSSSVSLQSLGEIIIRAELVLIVVAIVGLAFWLNPSKIAVLMAALGILVLGLVSWHATALLSYEGSPAELLARTRTSADVRAMAREIADAADALAVARRSDRVRVALDNPSIVRWYLRDRRNVLYGTRPADDGIVVQPAEADPPSGSFAALRFRLQTNWSGEADTADWWRWLTLREAATLRSNDLVVYVRTPGQ